MRRSTVFLFISALALVSCRNRNESVSGQAAIADKAETEELPGGVTSGRAAPDPVPPVTVPVRIVVQQKVASATVSAAPSAPAPAAALAPDPRLAANAVQMLADKRRINELTRWNRKLRNSNASLKKQLQAYEDAPAPTPPPPAPLSPADAARLDALAADVAKLEARADREFTNLEFSYLDFIKQASVYEAYRIKKFCADPATKSMADDPNIKDLCLY